MIGLAWAASRAAQGDVLVVITLSVAIFITSWRTITPIRFGEPGMLPLLKAVGDVALLSAAIGVSGSLSSPFVGSLFVAMAVAGFGWGLAIGVLSGMLAVVLSSVASLIVGDGLQYPGPLAVTALAAAAIVPGVALDRLVDMELRRKALAAQRDRLAETNELLALLTDVARTLPSSLDLNDVVQGTREQLTETFPDFALGWRILATCYAHLDRISDARSAVDRLLRLAPHDNIQLVGRAIPVSRAEDQEKFLDGLRKAGLPES